MKYGAGCRLFLYSDSIHLAIYDHMPVPLTVMSGFCVGVLV